MKLQTRALIYFAANPDEVLNTKDMEVKWGLDPVRLTDALRQLVNTGMLVKSRRRDEESGSGRRTYYEAGPELKKELGL